jgi:hypothetical protein
LVRRIRRAYAAHGVLFSSKTALTKDPLEAMLATGTDGLMLPPRSKARVGEQQLSVYSRPNADLFAS